MFSNEENENRQMINGLNLVKCMHWRPKKNMRNGVPDVMKYMSWTDNFQRMESFELFWKWQLC